MKKIVLFIVLVSSVLLAKERIIALSPSINEIVFALGQGGEIVGNTTFCEYPKESLEIAKVGGYYEPSLEKILSLDPSLVIMQQNNYKLSQKLNYLGIKTKIVKIDTLQNIKGSILSIGSLVQKQQEAQKIVERIDSALLTLRGITANKRVLVVFGHNTALDHGIYVAGQNLYFDEIINISQNTNALHSKRKGQPVLNVENILATNPDIIILLAHSLKEKNLEAEDVIKPWRTLPINAAKTDSIYIIDQKYAGIPSDRIVYFIDDFKKILEDYAKNN